MEYYIKNFLSVKNGSHTPQLSIKTFKPKSGKTHFIVSAAIELQKNHIPFLLMSNDVGVEHLADTLQNMYRSKYGTDDNDWYGNHLVYQSSSMSDDKIFNMCKLMKESYGTKVMLFDFVKDSSTVAVLDKIVTDLGVDVISVKQVAI